MITGELNNKIDGLWDVFAAGGLVNPLEVIEQITYLMFIHDLDDSDNKRAKESAMLGLPFTSIFSEEVKIGERTIEGSQIDTTMQYAVVNQNNVKNSHRRYIA